MSEENVEVVRQTLGAFNRRDWDEWESHHHPAFEWSDPPGFPGGGRHRGFADVRRFIDGVLETADEWQVEIDDVESIGDERVFLRGRSVLVGRKSGMAMVDPLFQLFELVDGRISHVQTFRSSEEALEAAGLSE
jgi:ketosteroid isomerase-like protein